MSLIIVHGKHADESQKERRQIHQIREIDPCNASVYADSRKRVVTARLG